MVSIDTIQFLSFVVFYVKYLEKWKQKKNEKNYETKCLYLFATNLIKKVINIESC